MIGAEVEDREVEGTRIRSLRFRREKGTARPVSVAVGKGGLFFGDAGATREALHEASAGSFWDTEGFRGVEKTIPADAVWLSLSTGRDQEHTMNTVGQVMSDVFESLSSIRDQAERIRKILQPNRWPDGKVASDHIELICSYAFLDGGLTCVSVARHK